MFAFLLLGAAAIGLPQIEGSNEFLAKGKANLDQVIATISDAVAPATSEEKQDIVATAPQAPVDTADTSSKPELKIETNPAKNTEVASKPSDNKDADTFTKVEGTASTITEKLVTTEKAKSFGNVETPKIITPTIDLLRVEPDGNTLVSGTATPNSTVELKNGETVLGKTTAGAGGDFVILTDKFLPKGDYDLKLHSRDSEGAEIAISGQSAIVSIPEKGDEKELLAMLTKEDGGIKDIIAKPVVEAPKGATEEKTDKVVEASKPDAENDKEPEEIKLATKDNSSDQVTKAETFKETFTNEVAKEERGTVTPTVKDDTKIASLENDQAKTTPQETIIVQPAPDSTAKPTPAAAPAATALVEAVEVEGNKLFIAGSGTSGAALRIYFNNEPVGDTKVGEGDRFLFEKLIDIEPGSHKIRVDVLSWDGETVVSRAEVPFKREGSEKLVASLVQPKPKAIFDSVTVP